MKLIIETGMREWKLHFINHHYIVNKPLRQIWEDNHRMVCQMRN